MRDVIGWKFDESKTSLWPLVLKTVDLIILPLHPTYTFSCFIAMDCASSHSETSALIAVFKTAKVAYLDILSPVQETTENMFIEKHLLEETIAAPEQAPHRNRLKQIMLRRSLWNVANALLGESFERVSTGVCENLLAANKRCKSEGVQFIPSSFQLYTQHNILMNDSKIWYLRT